ncbi:MAG: hypothetical protein GXY36_19855 [Chloroflexi bacterium]|nr:hypothetical protein [Chloroflexota bacterium]
MLNVQTEHLENHTVRLTVDVEPERLEKAMQDAARRIAKKGRIPGFRPGKAPVSVVINLYGREYVLNEALDTLGNDIYREALDSIEIEPYAPGSLENINEEDGLKLTFVVPKRPSVELGDYRSIRLPFEVPEVTDEMVNDAMEELRQRQAVVEDVERAAQMGDQVTFDHIEVVLLPEAGDEAEAEADEPDDQPAAEETGAEAEASESEADEHDHEHDHEHDDDEEVVLHQHGFTRVLRDDDKDLLEGFSPQIVGLSAGDNTEFTLTMPDDYAVENLAGRTVRVDAIVQQVQARTEAEWSDTLAETISDGEHKTILELRMDVRKQLEQAAEESAEQELIDKAIDQLVEGATIAFPDEVVQDYLDDILQELDNNLRQQGLRLEDFLRITGQTEDDVRQQYRERAIVRARRALSLGALVDQEQLGVQDADIEGEIDRLSEALGGSQAGQFRQFLMADATRSDIANRMVTNRALARLAAIAKGENPPVGPDEPAEAEESAPDESAESAESAAEAAAPVAEEEAAVEASAPEEQPAASENETSE